MGFEIDFLPVGEGERGRIDNPKIETVIRLADALNITIDELTGKKTY